MIISVRKPEAEYQYEVLDAFQHSERAPVIVTVRLVRRRIVPPRERMAAAVMQVAMRAMGDNPY